jgi:hypothetical protein
LRQRQREQPAVAAAKLQHRGNRKHHQAVFNAINRQHQNAHQQRFGRDHAEIQRRADRKEEQAEQQAFERLQIALQLMPDNGFPASTTPATKAPSAGERPTCVISNATPTIKEQRRRREQLAQARFRQNRKATRHHELTRDHNRHHRAQRDRAAAPSAAVSCSQPWCSVAAPPRSEQREHREHRDDGDVLEQQHRERSAPPSVASAAFSLQALKHDRRR